MTIRQNLIVTSLSDNPLIKNKKYLGHWCVDDNYESKKKIKFAYHWNDINKKNKDFLKINNLYFFFLKRIFKIFNNIHKKKYSIKQIEIILGPWLYSFISIVFERFENLKKINFKKIDNVFIKKYHKNDLVQKDYNHFMENYSLDEGNNNIYGEILKKFYNINIKFSKNKKKIENKKKKIKISIKNRIIILLKSFLNIINLKNSRIIFQIDPYINFFDRFILELRFFQIPFFPEIYIFSKNKNLDWDRRSWEKYNWNFKKKKKIINILAYLIPKCIPKSYLEDFKNIVNFSTSNWPKKINLIFTASAHEHNDVFKIWYTNLENFKKVKLVTNQHGGSFFLSKNHWQEIYQKRISYKFLTWGKKKKRNMSFYKPSNKIVYPNKKGGLLIAAYKYRKYQWVCNSSLVGYPNVLYLNNRINLLNELSANIKKKIILRTKIPLGEERSYLYQEQFLKKKFPSVIFENQHNCLINKSLEKSRLLYAEANQTLYLDALAMNFPTIIFFDQKYDEIKRKELNNLNWLIEAEILFTNSQKAANKINNVWDSIDSWWLSKKTQKAINTFCYHYSRKTNSYNFKLYSLLKKII